MTIQTISILLLFVFLMIPQQSDAQSERTETATFAGGCFWCMEEPFESRNGIIEAVAGYTGGHTLNPTYEDVCTGRTGHIEAVEITFDPSKISYAELLDIFWRQIDPTDAGGQFADRGSQYETAIFYHSEEQRQIAEASKNQLGRSGKFSRAIATQIREAERFYVAEDYHQNYYKECPVPYKNYSRGSGRAPYLERTWGDNMTFTTVTTSKDSPKYSRPSDTELREKLTPLQYEVTQKEGTERAFDNTYWDNTREGIYVDIVSGEPLFSSKDKYKSGTGWPSFTKPLEPAYIVEKEDRRLFSVRTEVKSKFGGSHLGHVFDDGPAPTGLRYCMNSAALRFVPKEDLEKEGYGEYLKLFDQQ